ncbi:MAG TPA: SigE family RNA polymerase sigma factor [Phycicoccus sp.]|nr:SigE family RNA polymerase sigma factor [Phycicoccus sp.]
MSGQRPAPSSESLTTGGGFDAYVAARGGDLLRSAYLLTGDHQRAEDLVQTALSKVWPRWDRVVAGDASPHAYVRRVMVTTYIAWWRRRWNGEHPTDVLPEPTTPVRDEPDRVDLVRALATLPRGQRAVLVLRYVEDLSEAQTAKALGCSVGTVKSQCSRGLAALRRSPLLAADEEPA